MEYVTEIPVECSTAGEAAGVIWSGWSTFGDREVVREASAKGTHIDLACKCLAYRRHCTISEAKKYFTEEVEIWVDEMLEKQQIHRASHILNNTGRNPWQFIADKCIGCKEPKLRKYLANYVIAKDSFEEKYKESWNIMNSITLFEEKYGLKESLMDDRCIQEVSYLPEIIKTALVTDLYFYTEESYLLDKLKNTTLWDYLLCNNKIDSIVSWIDVNYRKSRDIGALNEEILLKEAFSRLEIVEDMVEHVQTSSATNPTKELVLSRLSRYGVFTKKERQDVRSILSRLFSDRKTPREFEEIFSQESCNIDRDNFEKKLFSILYYRSASGNSSLQDRECNERGLLKLLIELCETSGENEMILQRGILENINTLCTDFDEYYRNDPLAVFTLAFLEYKKRRRHANCQLKDIFEDENGLKIDSWLVSADIIRDSLRNLPYLDRFFAEEPRTKDVTMYELLNGYENLDVRRLLKWRYREEAMPSFASEYLTNKYGRKEKLNYVYYLKEARPSMAAHVLQQQQKKSRDSSSSRMKYQAASCAHAFCLEHSGDEEIMCSCVAFIEMLGVDSQCLRLHATAADYVKKALNISIYESLQSISPRSQKNLETIMKHLEDSFRSFVTSETFNDTERFVEALRTWDFIVRFAKVHNSSLPCSFLKIIASNNLWFEFVLVGHLFAHPLGQMLESAREFENLSIREHLSLALSNSHILTGSCFRKDLPEVKSRGSPSSSPAKFSADQSIGGEEESDLWLIVLKCHQSQDPPGALLIASQSTKSPIFTVLATCYEPSAISAYCYSWLVVSARNDELTNTYASCLSDQLWPAQSVRQLFRSLLALEHIDTISRGFHIFMPDNPLCDFFQFFVESAVLGDFDECREKLRKFMRDCSGLKSNRSIDWQSSDTDYLHNSYWIVTVAIECVMTLLGKCLRSTHLRIKFLDILVECKFNENLHADTPNFFDLRQIVDILKNTKTSFDFSSIRLTHEGSNVDHEIERCIRELVRLEDFDSALELSRVAGFPCSTIILARYRSEFKRASNNSGKLESSFWKRCADDLNKYKVSFEDAAAFFVEHAEKVSSHEERYELLKLGLETLEPIVTDKQTLDTVEMAVWKSCILAGPDTIEIENEPGVFNKLKAELLSGIVELQVSCTLNDAAEESAIELLINRFITAGQLGTALRISTIFNYKHRDLQILMLCLSLAEGEISPYQLTSQQRSLLSESGRVKRQKYTTLRNRGFQRRSSSTSSPASSSNANNSGDVADSSNFMIQRIQLESLSMIDRLVKSLQNGFAIGTRVLLCAKLATYLRRSYQSLLTLDDPMKLLYEVGGSNCDRKLEMVGDIIAAYRIKNEMVAKFLAEEIVDNTPRLVEESLEDSLVMWGNPMGANIQAIIDLCNDPSLLGWELLKTANSSLGNSHGERRNVLTLKVAVELLIRSHDCFTASCSMEGIASILRKAQHLVYTLQQRKHWSLLVRLVTGLGRFNEMNYVFQILKENDQFEFLLGKGLDKIPGLKTALLEFCKRQCPTDKELFTLVALHFLLYNEIAFKWESEAKDIVSELVAEARKNSPKTSLTQQTGLKFTKNDNVEKNLQVIIENFTHATEYYLQDNKLNLASRCSHQAQLAALQMSLLASVSQNQQVVCLFNLSPEDVNRAMCQDLTLAQTLILVQAYSHHCDWSMAIYHHVVMNGKARYLKEFLACNLLTSAIVQDCVCRYRTEKTITRQMTDNMKTLVCKLNDVECKYMLASQLGFKTMIEEMLANPSTGSYLKDTVWKQGFNTKDFMGESYRV